MAGLWDRFRRKSGPGLRAPEPPSSLPVQIITAIKAEDADALTRLMAENPEQLNMQTFMGGQTWLGYAAQVGKLGAIKALAAIGADIQKGDREGARPLVSACSFGNVPVAAWLIAEGSLMDTDLSVKNPLFAAITGRSPACVRLLLDAGIDAGARYNSRTMKEMDAVAFALMRGEQQCAEMIAAHLAGGDAERAAELLAAADRIADLNAYGPKGKPKPKAKPE